MDPMRKSPGRTLNFGEAGRHAAERLANYDGDSFLVDELVESGSGYTVERAQSEVQDPEFLKSWLEFDGIKEILADRLACKGLRKAILEKRADVINTLIAELQYLKIPKKRGPKAKMVDNKHLYERVKILRDQQHLSFGQIAQKIYRDSKKHNLAAAHYRQAKKKQAAEPPLMPVAAQQ